MKPKQPFSPDGNLPAVFDLVWQHLQNAVTDANHGWHFPALATITQNQQPAVRTVVLRHVDANTLELCFHSDIRAAKIAQLTTRPTVEWMFYDSDLQAQLRVRATARVHHEDAVAIEHWERSELTSRRAYLAPDAPGEIVDSPSCNLPLEFRERIPEACESEAGRVNFAVVTTQVERIDWLLLNRRGNLSARLEVSGDRQVRRMWTLP